MPSSDARNAMLTRRRFLITGAPALVLASNAISSGDDRLPSLLEVPSGKFPGDYGFEHDPNHDDYQTIFGQRGAKCACGTGDCRVTDWRTTRFGSVLRYDVIVNRRW